MSTKAAPKAAHKSLDIPLITAISVGGGVVLLVVLYYFIRYLRRKPSTQLPPPREVFFQPYLQPSIPHSKHTSYSPGGSYIDESGVQYGPRPPWLSHGYSASTSGSSPNNSWTKSVAESSIGGTTLYSSATASGRLFDGPPTPIDSPLDSSRPPTSYPASPLSPNPSPLLTASNVPALHSSSSLNVAAPTDQPNSQPSPQLSPDPASNPSTALHGFSEPVRSPPPDASLRPFPEASGSQQGIGFVNTRNNQVQAPGAPNQQPPDVQFPRRQSRHSMYSMASTAYLPPGDRQQRRMSMRGAPHKTNVQVVMPEPLAPSLGPHGGEMDFVGSVDARRASLRRSRVDLWAETHAPRSNTPSIEREPSRKLKKSRENLDSGSLEMEDRPRSRNDHFVHPERPPPLPATFSSRSGTPVGSMPPSTGIPSNFNGPHPYHPPPSGPHDHVHRLPETRLS